MPDRTAILAATAALLSAGTAAGCLPHGAAGRPASAMVYELRPVGHEGGDPLPVLVQWARGHADGSNGWVVCLGKPPTRESPGTCLELRSFPTGEILELRGLDAYTGSPRHLEGLDGLWPALSPRVVDPGTESRMSWPLGRVGGRALRAVATGTWVRGPAPRWWSWSGTVETPDPVHTSERLAIDVELAGNGSVVGANWRWEGSTGRRLDGSLVRIGDAPPVAAAPCPLRDESPSRAPLCLEDGTVLDGGGRSVPPANLFSAPPTLLESRAEPQP